MTAKSCLLNLLIVFSAGLGFAHEDEIQSVETSFEEMGIATQILPFNCQKASASQLAEVNLGNEKAANFFEYCLEKTGKSPWCQEVMRPNPASLSTFQCTYGRDQTHQLIHPDERTWTFAVRGVQLVQALEKQGLKICQIYNWWRPEPYNANVGGKPGRHPQGTSLDVRFCSRDDMEKGFQQLCQWRKLGHIRAIGHYNTQALHFGVADRTANTWGKKCP